MTEKTATRGLIIEAVIDCIEKYGIDKVTTRRIAEQAGTNIASINYYFRSKDELVAAALTMTINHMLEDVQTILVDPNEPYPAMLETFFFYLLDGVMRFPGVSIAHLYSAIMEKQYDTPGARGIAKVFDQLVERTAREYPQHNREELQLMLAQIMHSILFNMLAPNFLPVASQYQLTSSANARKLASYYTKTFLNMMERN
jgi:AcrR family transcriptional regulator